MSRNQLKLLDDHGLASPVIREVRGRELVLGDGKRLIDFAGTNYLGFDFEPSLLGRADELAREWGALCGWSRLEADPAIFTGLEDRLARLLGVPGCLLSHTITMTAMSVLPAIVRDGLVLADRKLHSVIWEASRLARDHGARLERFDHQNLGHLEDLLRKHRDVSPKLVAVDGVYSISTELAPIRELQALCERYDAWLLVDDAHGFGILGQGPTPENPYGQGGLGVVARAGGDYGRTFYLASFGKAFCTHTAFLTLPEQFRKELPPQALAHIYSAPVSPHTIGTAMAALELNDSVGEQRRARIRELTRRMLAGLGALGWPVENHHLQPVVFVPIGDLDALVRGATQLRDAGVLGGLRAYPVVPADRCGVRFAITALHTEAQVDRVLEILGGARMPRPGIVARSAA